MCVCVYVCMYVCIHVICLFESNDGMHLSTEPSFSRYLIVSVSLCLTTCMTARLVSEPKYWIIRQLLRYSFEQSSPR